MTNKTKRQTRDNYTTAEVAEILGVSVRRAQQLAIAEGVGLSGRDYLIPAATVERLRGRDRTPGRKPSKGPKIVKARSSATR